MSAETLPRLRLSIVFLCFFLSGCAGLIYEVVWSRYLALFVGGTGTAHVIILSTFMGGMAIGAWLFGRIADKVQKPLQLYILLETIPAVLALLYPVMFEPIRNLFILVSKTTGLSGVGIHIAAAISAALTILLPTILMGSTLPVMSRYIIRNNELVGKRVADLYYLNSFGAVLGSIIGGFFLIRMLGLELSMVFAGCVNLGSAALAFILLKVEEQHGEGFTDTPAIAESEAAQPFIVEGTESERSRMALIALMVIGISGFISMVYEVAWIRLLTLVLGSSSYSFALMLAAFISGLTLGSWLLSRKKTDGGYYKILGWCEVGIGLTALLSICFYDSLPITLNQWRTSLVPGEHTYPLYELIKFLLSFMVMIVPTIFMGVTLPAASRVVACERGKLGQSIGNVYALNTLGMVAGAILGGYFFLPFLGIKHTIEVMVAFNVILGLIVLATLPRVQGQRHGLALQGGITVAVLVSIVYMIAVPAWDERIFMSGTYRIRSRIDSLDELKEKLVDRKLLYYRDGTNASIAVVEDPVQGEIPSRVLLINGKPDASSNPGDMQTQQLLGHLPMLLHPNPQDVLVVGLGSGVSLAATLQYEAQRSTCIELIPEVIEAARYFSDVNNGVMDDPRARILIQDAKTHLLLTDEKYDVLVNEPTNPWIAGVAGLFSEEYYKAASERLNEGGLFVQWIQIYELLDPTVYTMLSTLHDTFPYSVVFDVREADMIIVASKTPFAADFDRMDRMMAKEDLAADLRRIGIVGPLPILAMQVAAKSQTDGPHLTVGGILTDFWPTLEHDANRGFFIGSRASGFRWLDRRSAAPARSGLWIHEYLKTRTPSEETFQTYDRFLTGSLSLFPGSRAAWVNLWSRLHPDSAKATMAKASLAPNPASLQAAILQHENLKDDSQAAAFRMRLLWLDYTAQRSYLSLGDTEELSVAAQAMIDTKAPEAAEAHMILGELAMDRGEWSAGMARLVEAFKLFNAGSPETADFNVPRLYLLVIEGELALGNIAGARAGLEQAKTFVGDLEPMALILAEARIIQQERMRAP